MDEFYSRSREKGISSSEVSSRFLLSSVEEGRYKSTQLEEEENMAEEILKNIPAEVKWGWTASTHAATLVIRGETILAPIVGAEKWKEINVGIYGEGGKMLFPMIKDNFNVPVENAIDAANLAIVVATVTLGPEGEGEFVEESPERAVYRQTKCMWMDKYKEYNVDPQYIPCFEGHQAWGEEDAKAINPKISHKLTKAMPLGDPYCEAVWEFKK